MEELTRQIVDFVLGLRGPAVYAVVGLFAWGEVAFFLGVLTPGEVTIAVAGMLASRGQLALGGVVAAAAAGTVLGNVTGFWLGRRWGPRLREWGPVRRFLGRSLDSAGAFFRERGEWAVSIGSFVSYVRMFVPFLAGESGMSARRFAAYALPAGAVWAAGLAVVGYALGESWRLLQEAAGAAAFLVLILFLLALAIRRAASWAARRRRRFQALVRRLSRSSPVAAVRRRIRAQLRWLRRRLDPPVARGVQLAAGFAVLLAGAGASGVVLIQVRAVTGIALLDYPILTWMAATRTEAAVSVARTGLQPLLVPWFLITTLVVWLAAWWRLGRGAAARVCLGLLGAGIGAYVLDDHVLRPVVPRSAFPSVPVAVATSLLLHASAVAVSRLRWGRAVTAVSVAVFLASAVALATVVAGWAAPSGIALGAALGITWSTALELTWRFG